MNVENKYKVLARKYRPQKFEDLIGQNNLVEILSNAITSKRIAHAYILTGVRGIGKTTTARLIAMSINCINRLTNSAEPCGDCESCESIKSDNNIDVIEIDAASNTGVDDIREIIDNVKYKPVISEYKIFIIDEVHMLSKSAFNALLKTLEEPPDHVKFIFATTEVKKIPITVLSRCQRFDLHRVDNKTLSENILKISNFENVKIDKDAITAIVRVADGSVRDSLSLLDQAIVSQNDTITENLIINMLGLANREKIFTLLEHICNGNADEAIKTYNDLYNYGADVNMIFDELLNVVHLITQFKISPKIKDDEFVSDLEKSKAIYFSSNLTLNNINILWQVLFKGYSELQNQIHLHQHGEMIILRLIYLNTDNYTNEEIKKKDNFQADKTNNKLNLVENNLNIEDKLVNLQKFKSNQNLNTKSHNNITVTSFRQFVDIFFKNREAFLHTKLYNDVKLISFKEGEIILNTNNISDQSFIRNISKLISKWTGRIWNISSSTSNLGKSLKEEDIIIQQKEIEKMKNNPNVKKILNTFPGSAIHSISELAELDNKDEIINKDKKKEI